MASGQPPFFYHILMNPSSPHLPLPLKFVKKHLKSRALKKPILKSANGGYLWKLRMKKFDDHAFRFVDGWCKVVKDAGLLFGEFLLFKYVGSSVFLMHVFTVNGCEKILAPRIHNNFKVVDDEVEDEFSVFDDDDVEEDDDDADADVEYDLEEDEDEDNEEDDEVEFGDDDDEDDGEDEDVVDVDGHDGDPFFVITSSKRNKNKLRLPPDLVAMAKIKTKETINLKKDDGYEKVMPVRSYKQNKLTRYYVAEGWKEFQRSNDISEGDECVLKFITSEDKLCLAKVTKKKPRATEVDNDDMDDDDGMDEEGEAEDAKEDDSNVDGDDIFDDDVDDEGKGRNVKLVNENEDDEDDDVDGEGKGENAKLVNENEDDEDDDVDGEGKGENAKLVNENENDEDDDVDGEGKGESTKHVNENEDNEDDDVDGEAKGENAKLVNENEDNEDDDVDGEAKGENAELVYENEDDEDDDVDGEGKGENAKLVNENEDDEDDDVNGEAKGENAKLVNKNEDDEDGEGEGENAKLVNENEDDEDDDVYGEGKGENAKHVNENEGNEDDDVDGEAKGETAKLVNENEDNEDDDVDGEGKGENAKLVNENEDDEDDDVNGEGKGEIAKHVNENEDNEDDDVDGESKGENAKLVNENEDDEDDDVDGEGKGENAKHVNENEDDEDDDVDGDAKGENAKLVNENEDYEDDDPDVDGNDGDPSFILTCSDKNQYHLSFSADFVALAGINAKKTITLKNLDGYEKKLRVRSQSRQSRIVKSVTVQSRRNRLKGYFLSAGWKEFQRNSNISVGDKFVFKFIASEDKFCVAKITQKKTRARSLPPDAEAPVTEVEPVDEDVEDAMDKDENVEPVDDLDPFFVVTIKNHRFKLGLPTDFVSLAGTESKENVIMKSLDGNETLMSIRKDKRYSSTCYHLSVGWPAFKRSNNISEGDKCVFKYITSEDKLCLAKITKAPPTEVENGGDKDANKDAELIDDEDPFFRVTITPSHKSMLRLPSDFVELAGIYGKKNIIIKCLDGNEIEMLLRPVKQGHSTCCLSMGWPAFKRSNNILEGDECVFKYITSEDKMSLAKITKKITPPAEVDDNDLKVDDGMDGKNVMVDDTKDDDENVEPVDGMDGKDVVVDDNKHMDENFELVDDGMDVDADDNKDEDKDVEFVVTITPSHKSKLCLPPDFVRFAGIDGKKDIIIKCPDGNERKMVLTSVKQGRLTRYCLSIGWRAFKQSNNMSEGDECVFKYITSEDKMRLTLTTKKEARSTPLPPAAETTPTEVDDNTDGDEYVELDDDGIDDKDVNGDYIKDADGNVELADNGMDVDADENNYEVEKVERVNDGMDDKDVDEYVKLVDGMDDKDMEFDINNDEDENENVELVDDGMDDKDVDEYVKLVDGMNDKDVNEDAELVDDEDPYFRVTITSSHKSMLRLPPDFVGLAGINTKENIIIKSLDGNESQMAVRTYKQLHRSTQYHLSVGWPAYKRSNNISEGDECVFKYIISEDKMCLAKVNKEKIQTSLPSPAEVVKRKRARLPPATEIKFTVAENVKMRSRRPPPVEITVAEAVKRKRGPPPSSSPRVTKDVKSKKGRAAV